MSERVHYHLTLQCSPDAFATASAWLRDLGSRQGLSEEHLYNLDLCASELLANISEHAYNGAAGVIRLELVMSRATSTLTLVDTAPAFDPLTQSAPALPASLESAPCGGLGLHLVRQFADAVHYERKDGCNRLTIRIGPPEPSEQERRRQDRRSDGEVVFPLTRSDGTRIGWDQRSGDDRRALGLVSRTALFRDVPYRDVESIFAHCEIRSCADGEILLRAGEYHRCVLMVIAGRLEVHLDGPNSHDYIEVGPGECVGELSVADGRPNSAWVVAAGAGRLLVVAEAVFLERMLGHPTIARNLVAILAQRIRNSNRQIVARLRAAMELESLQRELDLARQIQSSMLPTAPLFPAQTGIEGCGFMRAARHVGGDFYDAFLLGDGRVFVAIGDVCNKGTPAALFMVRTLTLLRSEALRPEADAAVHLARLAVNSNNVLNEANEAQQFVTLFCAIVDLEQNHLHFVNAGHNPPLLCLPGAAPVFLEGPRNPLVGLVPGLKYAVGSSAFVPGSLLLLYTDGVTEAEAEDGALFGDDALHRLLTHEAVASADACVERIVAAVDAFAAGHPQSDDITLLAIHRPPDDQPFP
ncbi:MAG: cyclic nucleotide-binding domain-containing protein [Methylococcaceae bacterium]|nr:MAG: cyclic nucleotide-binding domain-containing protein [Methylococcaceae bacterium]